MDTHKKNKQDVEFRNCPNCLIMRLAQQPYQAVLKLMTLRGTWEVAEFITAV